MPHNFRPLTLDEHNAMIENVKRYPYVCQLIAHNRSAFAKIAHRGLISRYYPNDPYVLYTRISDSNNRVSELALYVYLLKLPAIFNREKDNAPAYRIGATKRPNLIRKWLEFAKSPIMMATGESNAFELIQCHNDDGKTVRDRALRASHDTGAVIDQATTQRLYAFYKNERGIEETRHLTPRDLMNVCSILYTGKPADTFL